MAVGRATAARLTPRSTRKWKTFGSRVRTSSPRVFPAWPWVSRSTSNTRSPRVFASQAATWTARVVFPVPPFLLTKAIRRTGRDAPLSSSDRELTHLLLDSAEHGLDVRHLPPQRFHVLGGGEVHRPQGGAEALVQHPLGGERALDQPLKRTDEALVGEQRLRDLAHPLRLHQLLHDRIVLEHGVPGDLEPTSQPPTGGVKRSRRSLTREGGFLRSGAALPSCPARCSTGVCWS